MAASKPTSQLSQQNHILRYTQPSLRDLSCRSGFFPSRRWTLSLSDCLPGSITQEFGVWLGEVSLFGSRTHPVLDRKSTRLNSSHTVISYAVFCLKKKNTPNDRSRRS